MLADKQTDRRVDRSTMPT